MNSGASRVAAASTSQPASLSPLPPPPPPASTSSTKSTTTTPATTDSRISSNLIEILVDNSNFVDIRQQDSGSNQSGSDSGLGHTNSVSSDNSTFTAVVQDFHQHQHSNNNNGTNSSSIRQANAGSASIRTTNNKLSSINESRTILDDATSKQSSSSAAASKSKETKQSDESAIRPVEARDGLVVSTSPQQQQQNFPVLKSLLKKSSRSIVLNDSTTSISHKRHVSFNQTVIVFCEEIEAPSPSDHFEPSADYQDSSTAFNNFDPPKDYRDHSLASGRKEESSSRVVNSIDGGYDDESNGDGLAKALGTDSASNLTDDQLLGLLEDESLLESLRLNCEDFSDDEFPVNYLNSNHSYLGNEAISDYDSDSQSSLCADRKDSRPLNAPARNATDILGKTKSLEYKETTNLEQSQSNCINGISRDTPRAKFSEETKKLPELKTSEHKNSVKSNRTQKTMPARMKVSTLDNAYSKRQSHHDHDLKAKVEPSENLESKDDEQILDNPETVSPPTLIIKQSTIEPITLSKTKIVSTGKSIPIDQAQNCIKRSGDEYNNPQTGNNPQTLVSLKPTNQINDERTGVRESISFTKGQESRINQTSINLNQVQASHAQNESACHICRAIESNRSHVNNESQNQANRMDFPRQMNLESNNNNNHHESYISLNRIRSVQNTVANKATDVFSQSCASCRENSTKQQNVMAQNETAHILAANIAQQPRPIACQLVYVVDQKGNRVRALSVIRPPNQSLAGPGQQVLAGRRIFIAQNGMRFPNPVSVVQPANLPTNLVNNPSHWASQNHTNGNNAHQYRVVGAAQAQPPTQVPRSQLVATQGGDVRTIVPSISFKAPVDGLGVRQHTVYYVRQPLGMQNIRQSFDSTNTNARSFPDPHEIRRLDGLRGPATAIHLAHRMDQADPSAKGTTASSGEPNPQSSGQAARKVPDSVNGEMDDPTFGFSKRPSVKVVATNSSLKPLNVGSKNSNIYCDSAATQELGAPYKNMLNVRRIHMIDQSGVVKPISEVVLGSQTLDRRNQNQQYAYSMKENLPSTSSMSNIHGTMASMKQSELSSNSYQQSRISGVNQAINSSSPDNAKLKGMISRGLKRWFADKFIFN